MTQKSFELVLETSGMAALLNGRCNFPRLPPCKRAPSGAINILYSVTYAQRRIRYMRKRNRIRYQSVIKIHQLIKQLCINLVFAEIRRADSVRSAADYSRTCHLTQGGVVYYIFHVYKAPPLHLFGN